MKKNWWWQWCCGCLLIWSCSSETQPIDINELSSNQDTVLIDSLAQDSLDQQDTLITDVSIDLEPGTIPDGWERVELGKGYYVGFPKEPKEYNKSDLNQVTYRHKRTAYLLTLSKTDLSQDSSFQQFRTEKDAYYDAIFDDLALEFAADIARKDEVDIGGYIGKKAVLSDEEGMVITAQCVFVGATLFSQNCIAWKGENERSLKTKALFFNSFGKDLYIE